MPEGKLRLLLPMFRPSMRVLTVTVLTVQSSRAEAIMGGLPNHSLLRLMPFVSEGQSSSLGTPGRRYNQLLKAEGGYIRDANTFINVGATVVISVCRLRKSVSVQRLCLGCSNPAHDAARYEIISRHLDITLIAIPGMPPRRTDCCSP